MDHLEQIDHNKAKFTLVIKPLLSAFKGRKISFAMSDWRPDSRNIRNCENWSNWRMISWRKRPILRCTWRATSKISASKVRFSAPSSRSKTALTSISNLFGFTFSELDAQFDVILIEPPLEEYARTYGVTGENLGIFFNLCQKDECFPSVFPGVKFWDWEKIMALDIGEIAAQRAFVFLWCGSSDGLDLGKNCRVFNIDFMCYMFEHVTILTQV